MRVLGCPAIAGVSLILAFSQREKEQGKIDFRSTFYTIIVLNWDCPLPFRSATRGLGLLLFLNSSLNKGAFFFLSLKAVHLIYNTRVRLKNP